MADGNGISDVLSPTPDETLSPFTRNFWTDRRLAIQIVFGVVVVQVAIVMVFWIQKLKRQRAECGNNAGGGAVFGFSLPALEWRGHGQSDRDRLPGR